MQNDYDRALRRSEVMAEMDFTATQADRFMRMYGQRVGAGKERAIRQSELHMMQLDGRMANFVKDWAPQPLPKREDDL